MRLIHHAVLHQHLCAELCDLVLAEPDAAGDVAYPRDCGFGLGVEERVVHEWEGLEGVAGNVGWWCGGGGEVEGCVVGGEVVEVPECHWVPFGPGDAGVEVAAGDGGFADEEGFEL